jgi:general L-amino acid transport system permease protein
VQEHDLTFVRAEMALAQKPPRSQAGLAAWLQKNLFATVPDAILTVIGVVLIALILPPVIRWGLLDAQWFGTDRSACSTVAQGGTQPDGWSGACWAFVKARFEVFMFGRYPIDERWRVILTGILFVALLVPLMIPRVPAKATNAVLFFGVFPVVAFMLLIGTALPFGLIGLAGFLIKLAFVIVSGLISLVFTIAAEVVFYAFAIYATLHDALNGSDRLGDTEAVGAGVRLLGNYIAAPIDYLAYKTDAIRTLAEDYVGVTRSLWLDLLVSAVIVLGAMAWSGAAPRTIGVTAGALVLAAVGLRLSGLDLGLPYVETALWGGLLVTLVLSFVGIAVSLPLGILLALGRRSKMPVIKLISVIFIEAVRGVPLITVLFMASFMLPLFVPPGVTFDKFLRALIGVALFASAYMAEVIRGGLQAIPKGQYEGADSLGLSYWQKTGLIILPQALKLVIPGIVNTFIGLFKDTSLVGIIGMFDLLGIVRQSFTDTNWISPQTPISGLIFAGFVFWLFCFGMSRYSIYMERRLDTGHKR